MSALLRAELIKLMTVRGTLGLLFGAVAVALIGAVSTIGSGEPEGLAVPLGDQQFFVLASVNLALFALILGIKMFTDEFRHGSIIPTMVLEPDRSRVLLAKAVVGALAGGILVLIAQATTLVVAHLLIGARGVDPSWTASDAVAAGGLVAAGALWAVIGVGVGAVVRHQVAAIVGGVVWIVIIENIGTGFLGDAARFLPGQAAHALARVTGFGDVLLAPAIGGLLFVGYAVLLTVIGTQALVRRDIAVA